MIANVKMVHGDDWDGLFINDKLVAEGHSLSPTTAIHFLIGYTVETLETFDVDLDWIEEMGSFPENFEEVKII